MTSTTNFPVPLRLDEWLEKLADVDKKVDDLLGTTREILTSFDRERQNAKTKMETMNKKYEENFESVQSGIAEQLMFMERMCVGAEHQGSTFHIYYPAETAQTRMEGLKRGLINISKMAAEYKADMQDSTMDCSVSSQQ